LRKNKDTPASVLLVKAGNLRKNGIFKAGGHEKKPKFFSKKRLSPLERRMAFVYNLHVVCLGMKW